MASQFQWGDPFLLEDQLDEEERMVRDVARDYCQGKLMPRILEANRHESFDRDIYYEMAELGMLGATLPEEYGGADLNYVSYGLIAREVERVDSGYRRRHECAERLGDVPDLRIRYRGAASTLFAKVGDRRVDRAASA